MPARYGHPEWRYLAPASAFMRRVGIVLVAMAIGATAGVCVVVSLIAGRGADTSITVRHALIGAEPVVNPPAVLAAADMPLPATEGRLLQPAPAEPSDSQRSILVPAAVDATHVETGAVPALASVEPTHVEARARVQRSARRRRAFEPKRRHAKHVWRGDLARARLRLVERLKPQ